MTVPRIEAAPSLGGDCNLAAGRNTLAVTAADVSARAALLPTEHLTLDFLTPTRIIEQKSALSQAPFAPLMRRLLERLSALEEAYGRGLQDGRELQHHDRDERSVSVELDAPVGRGLQIGRGLQTSTYQLLEHARAVTCIEDRRQWKIVRSYSFRQQRGMYISGFTGQATFAGDLTLFRELLVWGELVRVGKGAVKGNGWYKIVE